MPQDLAAYLQITQLESVAEFPLAARALRGLLARVDEHNAIRTAFTADLACSSQTVKALVVQAEDARQLHNMGTVKRAYSELCVFHSVLTLPAALALAACLLATCAHPLSFSCSLLVYCSRYTLNTELLGEFVKRRTNHEALLAALKLVNAMVQKASRLRVGDAKTRVVAGCRAAIKSGQVNALLDVIRTGQAERRR